MKKTSFIVGGILVALLVAGVFTTSGAFAQGTTTQTPAQGLNDGFGLQRGMRFGAGRMLNTDCLEAAAQALGISTDELTAKLQEGMTLTEIADEAGVDVQVVWDAIDAVRAENMRAEIAQAVADGTITQEHADWLLEGLDKGFISGHGFGLGLGRHGQPHALSATGS